VFRSLIICVDGGNVPSTATKRLPRFGVPCCALLVPSRATAATPAPVVCRARRALSWAKLLVLRTALLLQSLALKSGGQIFENPSIVTLRGCPSLPLLPASAAGTSTLSMCVSLRQPQRERCLPLCWWQQ